MNRCDECKHKDNCVCIPYGCECFELDLEEHDKQVRAEVLDELFNTEIRSEMTLKEIYEEVPINKFDEGWNECYEDFAEVAEQLKKKNMKEAEKIADKMSYREAIMNCLCARCVPYRKATKIKMKRLLECIGNDKPLWKSDEHFIKACNESYQQGKAEALNIDLDTPMHFTPEQKAWVKKYIAINGERQRIDGAREFAEWLATKRGFSKEWAEWHINHWQKEVENG